MPDEIIELEPRGPFRWSTFLALLCAWLVLIGLAVWLKIGALRILIVVMLFILVVYLFVGTLRLMKRRK